MSEAHPVTTGTYAYSTGGAPCPHVDDQAPNPVTLARRKQRRGIPLDAGEQALLRDYYRRYDKQKLTVHLRADRASEWQGLAESQGLSLASWLQERVVEALHGFDDLVADVRRQNSDLHDEVAGLRGTAGQLAVENSKLQSRLGELERSLLQAVDLVDRLAEVSP